MKRKLSRKLVLLTISTAIIIIATIAAIVVVHVHNRRYNDALAEIIIWPGGGFLRGAPVYRFIVTSDGTLISYYGYNLTNIGRVRISDSRLERMKADYYEWINILPYERGHHEWNDANNYERRHDSLRFIRERS